MMRMKKAKDALLSIVGMSYHFARLHPNGSGTAAFIFSLYLVCPFGFKFLTYAFATIYGAAIIIKVIANSPPYDLHEATLHSLNDREFPSLQSDSTDQRPKKQTIWAQMSRRRNFKIRIEDLETLDDDATTKQAPSLCFDDNRIDRLVNDPDNLEDRIGKIDQRDEGMSTVARRGASSCEVVTSNPDDSICDFGHEPKQSQSEASDSSEELEDEDEDEEDALGVRSQAVEWTEDDRQSLMDIGISELERNNRLENLISKRMVKKATSMKIQENLLDLDISHTGSIPPVNFSRNPFAPPHLSGDALESQFPGSAPSVLLPEQNPFDLPYDSNEENPSLIVDGIPASHPKDILSRHESFFYGPSFPPGIGEDSGPANSSRISLSEKRNVREPHYSRFRQESDKVQQGGRDEQLLSKMEGPESRPVASKNDETANSVHDHLKASSDEQYHEDASTGDGAEKESTSSTSEDQKDADAKSSTYDGTLDRQTGFMLEGREGEELSEGNDNKRKNPFGSFISQTELDKRDARLDDPLNGNQSSLEDH